MSYLNGFEFWYHFNWDKVCIVERICQLSCVPVSDTVGLIACRQVGGSPGQCAESVRRLVAESFDPASATYSHVAAH